MWLSSRAGKKGEKEGKKSVILVYYTRVWGLILIFWYSWKLEATEEVALKKHILCALCQIIGIECYLNVNERPFYSGTYYLCGSTVSPFEVYFHLTLVLWGTNRQWWLAGWTCMISNFPLGTNKEKKKSLNTTFNMAGICGVFPCNRESIILHHSSFTWLRALWVMAISWMRNR